MITIRQLLEKMNERLDDRAKDSFIDNINGDHLDIIITVQGPLDGINRKQPGVSYWFDITK